VGTDKYILHCDIVKVGNV